MSLDHPGSASQLVAHWLVRFFSGQNRTSHSWCSAAGESCGLLLQPLTMVPFALSPCPDESIITRCDPCTSLLPSAGDLNACYNLRALGVKSRPSPGYLVMFWMNAMPSHALLPRLPAQPGVGELDSGADFEPWRG